MARTSIDDLLKIQKSISAMEGLLNSSIQGSLGNYKSILNAITAMACIADSSGEIIYLNEAFEKLTGRSASWHAGRPLAFLFEDSEAQKAISPNELDEPGPDATVGNGMSTQAASAPQKVNLRRPDIMSAVQAQAKGRRRRDDRSPAEQPPKDLVLELTQGAVAHEPPWLRAAPKLRQSGGPRQCAGGHRTARLPAS